MRSVRAASSIGGAGRRRGGLPTPRAPDREALGGWGPREPSPAGGGDRPGSHEAGAGGWGASQGRARVPGRGGRFGGCLPSRGARNNSDCPGPGAGAQLRRALAGAPPPCPRSARERSTGGQPTAGPSRRSARTRRAGRPAPPACPAVDLRAPRAARGWPPGAPRARAVFQVNPNGTQCAHSTGVAGRVPPRPAAGSRQQAQR